MKKLVAVIFGGQSSEHEISCLSAKNVVNAIDRELFDVVLIGITAEGRWLYVEDEALILAGWRESSKRVIFSPDAETKGFYVTDLSGMQIECKICPDVIFPVLHGLYGEDGTIQGLFELAHIPYVGCGVFASAAGMDKFAAKVLVDSIGVRQAQFVPVFGHEANDANIDNAMDRVEAKLAYPVFVKPSRAGSSKGVSKATDRMSLRAAIMEAAKHDSKILVEESIVGRELECAVLGDIDVQASGVGEILAAADFYDFDAKYHDAESKTITDPDIPDAIREEIREDACRIFKVLDGCGLSRVDFFLDEKGVVFNEINTLPGFTAISMYPMLWEAKGLKKKELVTKLIDLAFSRSNE